MSKTCDCFNISISSFFLPLWRYLPSSCLRLCWCCSRIRIRTSRIQRKKRRFINVGIKFIRNASLIGRELNYGCYNYSAYHNSPWIYEKKKNVILRVPETFTSTHSLIRSAYSCKYTAKRKLIDCKWAMDNIHEWKITEAHTTWSVIKIEMRALDALSLFRLKKS